MNFYQYIKHFKKEHSARGDLARDIMVDRKSFPKSSNYDEILGYLGRREACQDAIWTFQKVYAGYNGIYAKVVM